MILGNMNQDTSGSTKHTDNHYQREITSTPDFQHETGSLLNNRMHNGSAVEMDIRSPDTQQHSDYRNHLASEEISDLLKVDVSEGNDTIARTTFQQDPESPSEEEEQNQIPEQSLTQEQWDDYLNDTTCGIGQWRPQWLQKLASKKTYILVYGMIGMIYVAIGSYFISTISTVEKRFKIPSRTSGMIASAWDVGVLISTLAMSYLGGRGHKTRWVACGCLVLAVSCVIRIVPHMIFGPGQDALQLTEEYEKAYGVTRANASLVKEEPVCKSEYPEEEDCSAGSSSAIPSAIFLLSSVIPGIGMSMYHALGMAYLDDNVRKDKTPYLLSILNCIRMVGSTIGYLYGSYALQKYVDTSVHPTITSDDPRWIGAWWHAWGPFGVMCLLLSGALLLFPRHLPRAAQRMRNAIAAGEPIKRSTTTSFSDFKIVLARLTKNKVLLFNSFSSVFYAFGLIGYWIFMPKYMETQFRQSASTSSLVTGSVGLMCSAMGVVASGAIISKFKPRPRYLAAWNVVVEFLDAMGHFSYGFMSCTLDDLHGTMKPDNSWDLTADCNRDCDCGPTVKYSPVCASDGSNTFYSACHAGCTTVDMINGTKMYGNCSCIGTDGMGWAVDGACPLDCTTNFAIFLVVQCIIRFFSSSGRAGNTIIQFRCVDQDDKSVSIGFTEALLCALAFIPGPIIYGMLLDSACIVWGQTCGQPGNCWLYNGRRLGFLLNFTASAFLVGGTILDIGVWYHVKDLQIYDKEDETDYTKKKKNSKHKLKRDEQERLSQQNEPSELPLL